MKPLPFRSRLRSLATAAAIGLLASACSILPKSSPTQIWQPPQAPTVATAKGDFSLRVDAPNVTGMLDHTGIVVLPAPGQVELYKGARWSESPAILLRHRLVDAFMAAGLPAVTTDDDHFASDYVLDGALRAFQSEYHAGTPKVVVRYDALLRRGGSRQVLAERSFLVNETPAGTAIPPVVAAFGKADDALAQQVTDWVIDTANRDRANPPPHTDADTD